MSNQVISVASAQHGFSRGRHHTTSLLNRRASERAEKNVVAEMLRWCADFFEAPRARFVRRMTDGSWSVQTLVNDTAVSQSADRAEIAMAWTVGLSRAPVMVTRPRIANSDGNGLRPIAMSNYIGIPVICQDELLGIIELAGSSREDLDLIIDQPEDRIAQFAERIQHDPALRKRPAVVPNETICGLSSAFGGGPGVKLSREEWEFVAALDEPRQIDELAGQISIPEERLPEVARSLVSRGLITMQTPTRPLSRPAGSTIEPAITPGDRPEDPQD